MFDYNCGTNVSDLNNQSENYIDNILEATGLNWECEMSPIQYGAFGEHSTNKVQALFRSDTGDFIDVYRGRKPRNNRDIIGFINTLLSLADLKIEKVGSFGNETIWVSALLEETDVKKVGDIVKTRLFVTDTHMSNNGMKMKLHHYRLVCSNGMTQPVRLQNLTINHTANGVNRKVARQCLNLCVSGLERYQTIMEGLTEVPMSADTAMIQLIQAFGDPDKSIEKQPETVKSIFGLFDGKAQGSEMLSAYKTAYGLLQAVTEHYSHHTTVPSSLQRFQSLTTGTYYEKIKSFQKQLVRLV